MTKKALHRVPVLSSVLNELNRDIQKLGISKAIARLSKKAHTQLDVVMSEKTKRILAKERVILIGNHPTDTEPVALFAALPSREDTKLIITDHMMGVSPELDKYFIPVHVQVHSVGNPAPWRPTAYLAGATQEKKTWTHEEAHAFNVRQIQKASDELARGALIMIFPGERKKDGHWFPGVGYLLANAKTTQPLYFVGAFVTGTSHWDYLRLFPHLGRLFSPITVTFSEPLKINYLQKQPGKQIARELEDIYHDSLEK